MLDNRQHASIQVRNLKMDIGTESIGSVRRVETSKSEKRGFQLVSVTKLSDDSSPEASEALP